MTMKNDYQNISGVFILDKPLEISSNKALQKIRHLFHATKAGHTGSLDVLASGLLPICFGEATKFSQYLLDADKTYVTTAKLGERTETCDAEGEIVEKKDVPELTPEAIEEVLEKFRGETMQIPSMYSALKHKGKPLYEYARKGIEIERAPRNINVFELKLLNSKNNQLELFVRCSKGTYIRNLVDDIGQQLNCGAHVIKLRRIGAGPFKEAQMQTLEQVEGKTLEDLRANLLPMDVLLANLPKIEITKEQALKLKQGQLVDFKTELKPEIVRLYAENRFYGLALLNEHGILKAKRMCQ
jgi:tRNA pseudouridine55 synthase